MTPQNKSYDDHTFTELDRLAVGFINGEFDLDTYKSLNAINKFLVLSMAGLYASTKIGFCSGKLCAQNKYDLIKEYRLFATNMCWILSEHKEWVRRTRDMNGKLCDLAKALQSKDKEALPMALHIIDLLTRDDVYNQMLFDLDNSDEFKSDCIKTLAKNEDYFFESFGNIPYVDLLYKFFNSVKEDKITEIFKELDDDNIRKVARHVPVKSDDCNGIYKSYCQLLNIKYQES